ncbi:MAG: hypothetical protein IIB19_02530 [Chloroflexi bacterium]|nr:hypothetical protein [Chloroflexota bacterium]
MDAGRSRQRATGKHEWNSFENYRDIHEKVLEEHPLIQSHSVVIQLFEFDDDVLVAVKGEIRCTNGIILEVEKYGDCELRGKSRLWVRTFSYRYNAYIPGKHTVLRYDNGHGVDEYHTHRYDPKAGREGPAQLISREDMPVMGEVLSELAKLFPA